MERVKAGLAAAIEFVKAKPRIIFLFAALATQVMEAADIIVNPEMLETVLDIVTLAILGRVMQKSETNKML